MTKSKPQLTKKQLSMAAKHFPRIYSISTVGIRNHGNSDFLIHPLRTDFTGQSGTGKSLLGADLPQLILTAGREYKSATKPKGDIQREIYSIPLSTSDFGYTFMNIECAKNKFIVIGVFIRKSPKQLHPFIIQGNQGINPENNPNFKLIDHLVRYRDFINENEVLTIENLKIHLDKKGIYLTSYYRNIPDYHKLLYHNKILDLDLSSDENLQKQYANTIQSLSRGEDIAISGMKFKRFLFQYDDEIHETFMIQAKAIEQDHKKYLESLNAQISLSEKKQALTGLVSLKRAIDKIIDDLCTKQTIYDHQQLTTKQEELKKQTNSLFEASLKLIITRRNANNIAIYKSEGQLTGTLKSFQDKKKQYKEEKANLERFATEIKVIASIIDNLGEQFKELGEINKKVISVENWLKVYSTVENIRHKYREQQLILSNRNKNRILSEYLKSNNLVEQFENSEYVKSFFDAQSYYFTRTQHLENDKTTLEKLKDILVSNKPDTLAGWTINKKIKLNMLQEAALFHFATYPTLSSSSNYIPDPELFINSLKKEIKETDNTFIIDLAGIHYHIPKRNEYIFSSPETLKLELDKIGEDYKRRLDALNKELLAINSLTKMVKDLNYSEDFVQAYKSRDYDLSFITDASLNITEEQLNDRLKEYEIDKLKPAEEKIGVIFQKISTEFIDKSATLEKRNSRKAELDSKIQDLNNDLKTHYKEYQQTIKEYILLKETEKKSIFDLENWKSGMQGFDKFIENPLTDYESLIRNTITRLKNSAENEEELSQLLGKYKADIQTTNKILPHLEKIYLTSCDHYKKHFGKEFDPDILSTTISQEDLQSLKKSESKETATYESKFIQILETYNEILKDNPKLTNIDYDLDSLIIELIPQEIITNKDNPAESLEKDIDKQLATLNNQINELNREETKKIYNTVVGLKGTVGKQTNNLERVKALLRDLHLASYHKVQLEWYPSRTYDISWIDAFKKDINDLNYSFSLFGDKSEANAYQLLESAFGKYCPFKGELTAKDILNPFNYYDASARIVDPQGNPSPGSSGQNYGMLALLCIAKLSIVEGKKSLIDQNEIKPGIRLLPIDEVAGLGENFDMLYEIAQKLDYQIFTMTITANDLNFENGKQIYYEFIKSSEENNHENNDGIQACFSKDDLIEDVETYFSENEFSLNPKTVSAGGTEINNTR